MAQKTIVTKERLAYYDQKIKAEIAKKGDVKGVKFSGEEPLLPDSNGIINFPDEIVEGTVDSTYNGVLLKYKNGTDEKSINFVHPEGNNIFRIIENGTNEYQLPIKKYVDDLAESLSGQSFEKVDTLPATGSNGIVYLVPSAQQTGTYDEYYWVNKGTDSEPNFGFEKIGSTDIDLTGYVEESDLVEITTAEIDELFTPATP